MPCERGGKPATAPLPPGAWRLFPGTPARSGLQGAPAQPHQCYATILGAAAAAVPPPAGPCRKVAPESWLSLRLLSLLHFPALTSFSIPFITCVLAPPPGSGPALGRRRRRRRVLVVCRGGFFGAPCNWVLGVFRTCLGFSFECFKTRLEFSFLHFFHPCLIVCSMCFVCVCTFLLLFFSPFFLFLVFPLRLFTGVFPLLACRVSWFFFCLAGY